MSTIELGIDTFGELLLRSIELYGREVIPRVRELLAEAPPVRAGEGSVA
jgi:hypothetical protein